MRKLGRGSLVLSALLAGASCTVVQDEPEDTANCVVAEACCTLQSEETGSTDGSGAADCVGEDLNDDGWAAGNDLAGSGLEDDGGVLRLRPDTVTRVPVVWVTSTDENQVAKYDSVTGAEVLRVPVWGNFPNRTAVAADGSVWITNRESRSYIHIGRDGDVQCASEYNTCYTRAAAIDAAGYAWIGCNDTGELIQIDPTATEGTVELRNDLGETLTAPRCLEVARVQLEGTHPYGLVAYRDGSMWVGVLGSEPIAKVDTATATVIGQYNVAADPVVAANENCFSMYGMTIDTDGNPWLANMYCANVLKIDGATGAVVGAFAAPADQPMQMARAAGLDRQGNVWVADNGSQYVHQFQPDGTWIKRVDVGCGSDYPGTLGTGSDIDGNMWTVLQNSGKVVKYTTEGSIVGCYPEETPATPLLAGPYTYSDLTGSTLDLVTSKLGRWRGRVSQEAPMHWLLISYRAEVPAGTKVCVRARTSSTEAELETATFTAPYCESAADGTATAVDLTGQPEIVDSRFLEIELQLTSSDPTVSPRVSNLSVAARAP